MLVGLAAAIWAVQAGWHPLLALLVYSLAGSFALVVFAVAAVPRHLPHRQPRSSQPPAIPAPQRT